MDLLNEWVQFLNEYFKPILLILASIFTIYFAIQKIGNKVSARYDVSMELFSEEYISKIVLGNKKDKTISIWSIHAVIDKDIQLELIKFDPPLILNAHETTSISLPKYSDLYLKNEKIRPEFMFNDLKLHIDIGNKLVECENEKRKDTLKHFSKISKSIKKFNGNVYNENVLYILAYYYGDDPFTAFIDKSGLIGNEWNFSDNHIGKPDATPSEVEDFLQNSGLGSVFSNYLCFKVSYPDTELVFRKPATKKSA